MKTKLMLNLRSPWFGSDCLIIVSNIISDYYSGWFIGD